MNPSGISASGSCNNNNKSNNNNNNNNNGVSSNGIGNSTPPHPHHRHHRNNTAATAEISQLIHYAQTNYEQNPTQALSALMQALTLNGGKAEADRAMERLRQELGEEVVAGIGFGRNHTIQMERRAFQVIHDMVHDETTLLYERGQQDLLRQAMQDGSSVVCRKCNAMISSARWQQHQAYWCPTIITNNTDDNNDKDNDNDDMEIL